MKNAFYLTLKALFILKIFKFLSELFGHVEENGLIKKTILTFISKNKDNQTDKFGQLEEHNLGNLL